MPIPALNEHGLLPVGIHDCILAEIEVRFGQFQRTDQRTGLFRGLRDFMDEARKTGFVTAVLIDGSFVTDKDLPSDIDLILVIAAGHDFDASLRPFEYNIVSRRQVRRIYRLDVLVGGQGTPETDNHVEFFSRVRGRSDVRKGMLRVKL